MKAAVEIEVMKVHQDARGFLYEPLNAAQMAEYRNVHVVLTQPGAIRGNHRHVEGVEITTISGPALVRYRVDGELRDVQVPAGEVWRFRFQPGVAHAFRNDGAGPMILVSFNTLEHDPNKPDAVREVLLE